MPWKTGETVVVDFPTQSPTGAADADSPPTGTLVINGVDDGAAVTITHKATGVYKASVTLPTVADGDLLLIRANATVSGVAGNAIVWAGQGVISRPAMDSSGVGRAFDANGDAILSLNYYDTDTRLTSGNCTAAAAGTITLAGGASAVDNFYQNKAITIISGTGLGQTRAITAYNGTTKVATVSPNWVVTPVAPATYFIGAKDVSNAISLIQTGLSTLDAADVRDAIGLDSANLLTLLGLLASDDGFDGYNSITDSLAAAYDQRQNIINAIPDIYHADINYTVDASNTRDEYTVRLFKNGVRQTSGMSSVNIQVVKRSDGSSLIASSGMTQIASTGSYKYDATSTARMTAGESNEVIVTWSQDGNPRSFAKIIGRDASS
jgi:NADH:ubiquinone oxidoreductase subunit